MTAKLWSYVYAIGAAQGVLLAFALWRRPVNRAASRLLAVWIALIAIDLTINAIYLNYPRSAILPFYGSARFLPFLYGSLFYLYVRCLTEARALKPRDAVHFSGFAAIVLLNYDLFIQSFDQTQALFDRLARGEVPRRFKLIDFSLFGYSLSYVTAGLVVVRRYRARLLQRRSDADRMALRWVEALAISQVAIWAIALFQWLVHIPGVDQWLIYGAVTAWVLVTGYLSLGQTQVEAQRPLPQARASEADEARGTDVAERLERLMEDEKLYLKPALTIGELARRTGYPEYLVSTVINRRLGSNFCDYVTAHRVDEAARRLSDPTDDRTILDIAYDCGFTAKSTFNSAFKKRLGTTPSEYRRQRAG